ncbi:MATE family efflux transporter [Mediterraneibacter massiliensis]|nr:MATE family efflux transporter [Mediterraneibacter massiliensis]
MAAFAFSGLYTIVDGFFIGQNIGDHGIAAVNIAYPITALIQAIGTGIGMGGAIWVAISLGESDNKKKNVYLGNTFVLLAAFSFFVTVFLMITYRPLLIFFGAKGIILEYAVDYLRVIVLGTIFQLCSVGFVPIIRNFGGAFVAMIAMIAGFVSNILGDWLFTSVFQMGTAGAALATVLGQMIALLPCLIFIFKKKNLIRCAVFRPVYSSVYKISVTALAPFGSIISPMIVIVVMNKAALTYGGELEVACYAVISYVISISNLLMQGIGDGVQPLLSRAYGSNEKVTLAKLKKQAYGLAILTGVICICGFYASISSVPVMFGASYEVAQLYKKALPFFLIGLIFIPVVKVTICYLYATDKVKLSYLLIYLEPITVALFAGIILPAFWGLQGVWMAIPVTQFLLSVMSTGFLILERLKR